VYDHALISWLKVHKSDLFKNVKWIDSTIVNTDETKYVFSAEIDGVNKNYVRDVVTNVLQAQKVEIIRVEFV
jgi:hypothetical protein